MIVILEGPDNTGKSTFAEYLAKRFNTPIQHSPGPLNRDVLHKFMDEAFTRDIFSYKKLFLFDRMPMFSEVVYGTSIRGNIVFSQQDLEMYDFQLKSTAHLVIFTDIPQAVAEKNWSERKQMEGVYERWTDIRERYAKLYTRCEAKDINVVKYSFPGDPENKIKAEIAERIFKALKLVGGKDCEYQ